MENTSNCDSVLTKSQKIATEWRYIDDNTRIRAFIRYDDDCGNGHNSFSITGDIQTKYKNRWEDSSFGCIHEEIAKYFPEYAHLIKWHLVSSEEPMHYIGNTLYFISDKDCWGYRKGEACCWSDYLKVNDCPITFKLDNNLLAFISNYDKSKDAIEIVSVPYNGKSNYDFAPKYTFLGCPLDWYKALFDTLEEAKQFKDALENHKCEIVTLPSDYSNGKARELDKARSSAIWPDATDEELLADDIKDRLLARLPQLMAEFRKDIEALGFVF